MNASIADKQVLVTANTWFAGGRRVPYDPSLHRVLTSGNEINSSNTRRLMVFERVVGAPDATERWLTMLPGYPDGSPTVMPKLTLC